jgi:hypothetical protein
MILLHLVVHITHKVIYIVFSTSLYLINIIHSICNSSIACLAGHLRTVDICGFCPRIVAQCGTNGLNIMMSPDFIGLAIPYVGKQK